MYRAFTLVALIALAVPAIGPVSAAPGDEQGQVRKEMREGKVRSLAEIEAKVLPGMNGWQYLGPAYDPAAMAYRLKFIRDGRVTFIDVDARSGQVLSRR